jgi:hypothetical protein
VASNIVRPQHEEWRAHGLRLHALCLSDGGKNDDALKAAAEAYDLCKTSVPTLAPLMVKLRAGIQSLGAGGKKEAAGEGVEAGGSLKTSTRPTLNLLFLLPRLYELSC